MVNQEHLAILKQGVKVWNQWRKEHLGILPDLSFADLREVNFNWADLYSGASNHDSFDWNNLDGANLRRADLTGASLEGIDLSNANLSEAKLVGVNLRYANLRGANLRGS